jgi:hypothetical protein
MSGLAQDFAAVLQGVMVREGFRPPEPTPEPKP